MSQPSSSAGTTARQPSLRRTNSGRSSPAPVAGSSSSASLSNASATARKSSNNATSTAVGFEEDRGLVMREREREEKRSERDGTSVGRAAGVDVGVTRPKRRLSRCVGGALFQQDQPGPGRGEIGNVSSFPCPLLRNFTLTPVTSSQLHHVVHTHLTTPSHLSTPVNPPRPLLSFISPSSPLRILPPPCGIPLLLCHGLPRPFSPTSLDHPPPSLLPAILLLLVLLIPASPPFPSQ